MIAGPDKVMGRRAALAHAEAVVWLTLLAVYGAVFMEWLFFATMPSFLSALAFRQRIAILFLAPLPLLILAVATVAISAVCRPPRPRRVLAMLVPAVVLCLSFMLLFDNFTATVFGFAIEKTQGWKRWTYVPVLAALAGIALQVTRAAVPYVRRRTAWRWIGVSLLGVSLAVAALQGGSRVFRSDLNTTLTNQPDILLISGDGLDARDMSCYGYERKTTPFLNRLAPETLFCENAFPNNAHTAGAMVSVLTGRLPTQLRVVYRPDILKGEDAYRHLPGLLRSFGYRTFHVSGRHYADAYDLNLRDGFDRSTFRGRGGPRWGGGIERLLGQGTAYFLEQMSDRVVSRLSHVAGRTSLTEAFTEVTDQDMAPSAVNDAARLDDLLHFVEASDKPFFAHVHLYVTHGPRFAPPHRVFSAGPQSANWMTDFYDDSILGFDHMLEEVFQRLDEAGRLQHTLVIVYTDHGSEFKTTRRVPLLFRFPGGANAGRIQDNVQNIDIAPTILDYLGVAKPEWMAGVSLLAGATGRLRPVFSASTRSGAVVTTERGLEVAADYRKPPFFTMGATTLIVCDRAYTAEWSLHRLVIQNVDGHTAPCVEADRPTSREAEALLVSHLRACGYDLTSVELPLIPVQLPDQDRWGPHRRRTRTRP